MKKTIYGPFLYGQELYVIGELDMYLLIGTNGIKKHTKMKDKTKIKEPKVGDKIYVPSSYYVYRGEDDFKGGLATINKVEASNHLPKDHFNYWMVGIEGRPSTMYNYGVLVEKQEVLKKEYAGRVAHSNPDFNPKFNQPNADWR